MQTPKSRREDTLSVLRAFGRRRKVSSPFGPGHQQRRYLEAVAGVPLDIEEIETEPRGELTARWRPKT